jgi:tripartite-type tricarboxylate transporter receptor subunit TctC
VLAVPAGTPEPIAALLEREARSALQLPDLVERFRAVNMRIVASSGNEAKARIAADSGLWSKVIEATGMRAD